MRRKEDIQKDIEMARRKQQYLMDQEKILMKQEKQLKRKERTRRLIERGAILEKYLKQPLILSNDQVVEILNEAFSLTGTRELLENIIRENIKKNSDQRRGASLPKD